MSNRIGKKGSKLYILIHTHFIKNKKPVTRQELFGLYKLRKYDIDMFKHILIEVGLIQKSPLSIKDRYSETKKIPRSEVAYQPSFIEIDSSELERYLE